MHIHAHKGYTGFSYSPYQRWQGGTIYGGREPKPPLQKPLAPRGTYVHRHGQRRRPGSMVTHKQRVHKFGRR